jgi:hypothetical protein
MDMNKLELITRIATLPEDDPRLEAVDRLRRDARNDAVTEGRELNITTAAKRAGLSRPSLYRTLAAGSLQAFHPYAGAHPKITEGELARWLTGRSATSRVHIR